MTKVLWILAAVIGLSLITAFMAAVAWDTQTKDLMQRLEGRSLDVAGTFSCDDLTGVPDPVNRYFRHVLADGQPYVRVVDLRTIGTFRTGADDHSWRPFRASQRFSTRPPGLVWDARIRMTPATPVYVRDAYVAGWGEMRGKVLALFPVVNEQGTKPLAAGELHRYLAEAIWFPTALLPTQGVSWTPIDATSALATFTDEGVTVSVRFVFTPEGDIAEIVAADRMRAIDGGYLPTPWAVRCSNYQDRQGMRIPISCEAEWRLPEGPMPYWRGDVREIRYMFAR